MAFLVLLTVTLLVVWRFQKGFWPGLCCGVAFLVSMPHEIQVGIAGSRPALTVHRTIMLLLLAFWLKKGQSKALERAVPFRNLLFCLVLTQGISLLFAEAFVPGLLEFCVYALENFLYFVLIVTVVRDLEDAVRLVRAVCLGLLGVAVLAFIEQYKGYSPMKYFPGYYEETIKATYSHRILLGTAMAMGWPLSMLWACAAPQAWQRALAWFAALLCIGACYFAHSRGPWLAAALVAVALGVLGSNKQRKWLAIIGGLATFVLIWNSGVRDTILNRAGSTFDDESQAQVSYQWRWELWHKAWNEISKSPIRLLLGYGPGATESLNWEGEVSTVEGFTSDSFSSWDNNWAAYLLEFGLLGFGVLLCFYTSMAARMIRIWRSAEGRQKEVVTLIIGALTVYTFMQTNVRIFVPQLNFIFWTVLAAGVALVSAPVESTLASEVPQNIEPDFERAVAGS